MNKVITSGSKYIDIDAYASVLGYRELLRANGENAYAVSSAQPNESVPEMIRSLSLQFDNYTPTDKDGFVIMDVSQPQFIDPIVDHDRIIKLIDHHVGFEPNWHDKIGDNAQFENVGAIATVIYEMFVSANILGLLSADLCKLLNSAILDNTLNLQSTVTTDRDIAAYNHMMELGNLDPNFAQQYFEQVEQSILSDLGNAILNDTKAQMPLNLPHTLGQVAVFNHDKVLSQIDLIKSIFSKVDDWAVSLISLKDGASHLISNQPKSQSKLTKLFGGQWSDDIMKLDKMYLRKEMIVRSLQTEQVR